MSSSCRCRGACSCGSGHNWAIRLAHSSTQQQRLCTCIYLQPPTQQLEHYASVVAAVCRTSRHYIRQTQTTSLCLIRAIAGQWRVWCW
jgi:hypothetical protein